MKKKIHTLICVLAFVMLVNAMNMTGFAKKENNEITVNRDYDLKVTVDGYQVEAHNNALINGEVERFPFVYNGRTYIALNDLGRILNMNVIWDGKSKTISISKKANPKPFDYIVENYSRILFSVKNSNLVNKTKYNAEVRKDIKIKSNGVVVALKNTDGSTVYPITQGGFTYLPVSAIGNVFGVDVKWDSKTKTVKLGEDYKWVELPKADVKILTGIGYRNAVREYPNLGGKDESRRYGCTMTGQYPKTDQTWNILELNGRFKEIKFETSINRDHIPTVIEVYYDGVLKTTVMAEDPKWLTYKNHAVNSFDHLSYSLDVTGVKELKFKYVIKGDNSIATVTIGDMILR